MKIGDIVCRKRPEMGKGFYKVQSVDGAFMQIRRVTKTGEYSKANGHRHGGTALQSNFVVTQLPK